MVRSPGDEYKLVVAQAVLKQIDAHLHATTDRVAVGLLLGQIYDCPESGIQYTVVRGIERIPDALVAAEGEEITDESWRAIDPEIRRHGARVLGWYRSRGRVTSQLQPLDAAAHMKRFKHPWQTALLVSPDLEQPRGAFYVYEARVGRIYTLPFHEMLEVHPVHGVAGARTWVRWQNYVTDADLGLLVEQTQQRAVEVEQRRAGPGLLDPLKDALEDAWAWVRAQRPVSHPSREVHLPGRPGGRTTAPGVRPSARPTHPVGGASVRDIGTRSRTPSPTHPQPVVDASFPPATPAPPPPPQVIFPEPEPATEPPPRPIRASSASAGSRGTHAPHAPHAPTAHAPGAHGPNAPPQIWLPHARSGTATPVDPGDDDYPSEAPDLRSPLAVVLPPDFYEGSAGSAWRRRALIASGVLALVALAWVGLRPRHADTPAPSRPAVSAPSDSAAPPAAIAARRPAAPAPSAVSGGAAVAPPAATPAAPAPQNAAPTPAASSDVPRSRAAAAPLSDAEALAQFDARADALALALRVMRGRLGTSGRDCGPTNAAHALVSDGFDALTAALQTAGPTLDLDRNMRFNKLAADVGDVDREWRRSRCARVAR